MDVIKDGRVATETGVGPRATGRWRDIPVSRPKVLLTPRARRRFDELYLSRLEGLQESFAEFVRVTDAAEKVALEDAFGKRIAWIVRCDASRDSFAEAEPYRTISTLAIVACFAPAIAVGGLSISGIVTGFAALVLAAGVGSVLLWPAAALIDVLLARPGAGESLLAALIFGAVLGAGCWLALTMRPAWFEILGGGAAGAAVVFGSVFLLALGGVAHEAMLRRRKLIRDPEAEIIETLLLVAGQLASIKPPGFRYAAENLSYVAQIVDRAWRQLVPAAETATVRARWRAMMAGAAAGMRDLSSRAAFPDPATATRLQQSLAIEVTAFVTGCYGDLLAGDPGGMDAGRPRLSRFLRGVGSLLAAVMPITLLLVLPQMFALELDKGVFGTLLTISVGWLVLYVISWLDPKRAANPGASGSNLLGQLLK